MVDLLLGMINVSLPIEWPRITLLVLDMLDSGHRYVHFVRRASNSVDFVEAFKVVHRHLESSTGQTGLRVSPDASLHLSSNA